MTLQDMLTRIDGQIGGQPASPKIDLANTDLTDLVGQDFTQSEWEAILTECHRRHGSSWVLDGEPSGDLIRFSDLSAKYEV